MKKSLHQYIKIRVRFNYTAHQNLSILLSSCCKKAVQKSLIISESGVLLPVADLYNALHFKEPFSE